MRTHRFETQTTDPRTRGREIGAAWAPYIGRSLTDYLHLYQTKGITDVQTTAARIGMAVDDWAPDLAEEIKGIAEGAGLEPWQVIILNARTELMATAATPGPGECSTAVYLPEDGSAPHTIQTWDWLVEICDDALLLGLIMESGVAVRTFTEFGMVGKIGVNSYGVGVHFNILNSTKDGGGDGVPVHLIARRVLDSAANLADAERIIGSAEVSASTAITVVSRSDDTAATFEVSPAGVGVVRAGLGESLTHTNHFLDPALIDFEDVPTWSATRARNDSLAAGQAALMINNPQERAIALSNAGGARTPICVYPGTERPWTESAESKITISLDVDAVQLGFAEGAPDRATPERWQTF